MSRLVVALCGLLAMISLAQAESCRRERGPAADSLVDQCTEVSPATHPPCNAANSCDMIESEIARGCGLLDEKSRPRFCRDF